MLIRILTVVIATIALQLPLVAMAGDFDWMKDFNISAQADQSGVKVRLGTSFQISGAEVNLAWSNTSSPADAYAVIALSDISGRPIKDVVSVYQSDGHKGWGNLARSLGIKPGSAAFKALKEGRYKNQQLVAAPTGLSINFSLGGGNKNNGNKNNAKKK